MIISYVEIRKNAREKAAAVFEIFGDMFGREKPSDKIP
jgi:hypothetical protein